MSANGTKRTCRDDCCLSAFRGKADIRQRSPTITIMSTRPSYSGVLGVENVGSQFLSLRQLLRIKPSVLGSRSEDRYVLRTRCSEPPHCRRHYNPFGVLCGPCFSQPLDCAHRYGFSMSLTACGVFLLAIRAFRNVIWGEETVCRPSSVSGSTRERHIRSLAARLRRSAPRATKCGG
jgi:hypothetical protein